MQYLNLYDNYAIFVHQTNNTNMEDIQKPNYDYSEVDKYAGISQDVDILGHGDLQPETFTAFMFTAKWAKLLAFVTIASIAISLLTTLFSFIKLGNGSNILSTLFTVVINGFIAAKLLGFANKATTANATQNSSELDASLYDLKGYYQINGIIMAILAVIMALGLVAGIIYLAAR
jgi:hypothetical protein